jgi:hypothetical protein
MKAMSLGALLNGIFSTKFKQIMPFCIISWSDSNLFRLSGGCVGADQQGPNEWFGINWQGSVFIFDISLFWDGH